MRQLAFSVVALLLAAALGCGDRNNREVGGVTDTMPTVTTPEPPLEADPGMRDFTFDQRQEFAQSIRNELAEIDQEIEALASQAKSQGGAVSDRALARIRASRQAVNRDLQRVDAATATNWEEVRSGVTQSVENLEESIQAAQPK
ncbi:MAG: hypothetical protein ACREMZ_13795 [Gemmatimonadales bacterium]